MRYIDILLESIDGKVEYRFGMAMTPENYVVQWAEHRRQSRVPLEPWEQAFQDCGQIQKAEELGYIRLGRDARCTVSLTDKGKELLRRHYGD